VRLAWPHELEDAAFESNRAGDGAGGAGPDSSAG
jgi:hypothetical protein